MLSNGFGIYADVEAKLSEDTYLIVAVDRLSIGYAPTFNVPKERFNGAGYSTLEEFSTVSVSAEISLSGDTGSLQSVNLGDALGGMIGELTCLLGVKEPLSGGRQDRRQRHFRPHQHFGIFGRCQHQAQPFQH